MKRYVWLWWPDGFNLNISLLTKCASAQRVNDVLFANVPSVLERDIPMRGIHMRTQIVRKIVATILSQMRWRWQRCPHCKGMTIVIHTDHPLGRWVSGYRRPIVFYRVSCRRCGYQSVVNSEEKLLTHPSIELSQLSRCACPCGCAFYFSLHDGGREYKVQLPDGSWVCKTCYIVCLYNDLDVLPIDDQ